MAADRGAFIDQSQSLNIHMAEPTTDKLTSMHFFGWRNVSRSAVHFVSAYLGSYGCRDKKNYDSNDPVRRSKSTSLQGLKTGMYYLRTKPAANPIQFTVDKSKLRNRDSVSSTSVSTKPTKSPNKNVDNTAENRKMNQQANENLEAMIACSRENKDACMACGS